MSIDLDERLQELLKHYSVEGAIIMTTDGAIIKSSLSKEVTARHANAAFNIVKSTRKNIQEDDQSNDVKFLRVTTRRFEYLITLDGQYVFAVLHKPPDLHSHDPKTTKRQF